MAKMTVFYANDANTTLWSELMFASKDGKMLEAVAAMKKVDGYKKVAEIEIDENKDFAANLEYAYELMQNGMVTESWTLSPPDGLTPLVDPIQHDGQDYGHRSMSMGDIVELDGSQYVVATFGFLKLPKSD